MARVSRHDPTTRPTQPAPLGTNLLPDPVPPTSPARDVRRALDLAAAVATVVLSWGLLRLGLTEAAGAVEREHLAAHAALALVFLAWPWANTPPDLRRVHLWAWTLPFLTLLLLPPGLRRFSPVALIALCGMLLAGWLRQPADGHELGSDARRWLYRLSTWASAGVAVAILLRPDAAVVPMDLRDVAGVVLRGGAFGAASGWLVVEWRNHSSAALCLAGAALLFSGPSATAALVLAATAGTACWSRRRNWAALLPWAALAAMTPPAAALLGFGAWGARIRRGWLAALIVTTALAALALQPRPWSQTSIDLGFAALLLGPVWLAGATPLSSRNLWTLASATALAVVGLRFFPPHVVLIAVAVQILRPTGEEKSREIEPAAPLFAFGAAWISSWLIAVLLLASYPWMRPAMLASQWRWALPGEPGVLPLLLGLGSLVGLLFARLATGAGTERRRWTSIAAVLACAALSAAALGWQEPMRAELLQRWPPRTLTADSTALEHGLSPANTSPDAAPVVWIDGATAASLDLAHDTPIARVGVDLPSGHWEGNVVLGRDVWDWRLPPPRTRKPDAGPPAPLFFWWTGSRADPVLARRYRGRLELQRTGDGAPPWRLRIQRNTELPKSTTLEVHQIAIEGARAAEGGP